MRDSATRWHDKSWQGWGSSLINERSNSIPIDKCIWDGKIYDLLHRHHGNVVGCGSYCNDHTQHLSYFSSLPWLSSLLCLWIFNSNCWQPYFVLITSTGKFTCLTLVNKGTFHQASSIVGDCGCIEPSPLLRQQHLCPLLDSTNFLPDNCIYFGSMRVRRHSLFECSISA